MTVGAAVCVLQVNVFEHVARPLDEVDHVRCPKAAVDVVSVAGVNRQTHTIAAKGVDQAGPPGRVRVLDILQHNGNAEVLGHLDRVAHGILHQCDLARLVAHVEHVVPVPQGQGGECNTICVAPIRCPIFSACSRRIRTTLRIAGSTLSSEKP